MTTFGFVTYDVGVKIPFVTISIQIHYSFLTLSPNSIGYQVRLESKLSPRTICTMCTYRVLLRTLMGSEESQVSHITHIIMDEIHERNKISDFLLIELRALLLKHPHLHLVLMSSSATAMDEYQVRFLWCPLMN